MQLDNLATAVLSFSSALILSLLLTPFVRSLAVRFNIYDHPTSAVKTHKTPVPYLGGVAIYIGFAVAMIFIRFFSSFPSGTLRSLRGILAGSTVMCLVGLIDDIKPDGLHYRTKFFFQIAAALMVIFFGVRIRFVNPPWLACALTVVWVVGLTNAFNLIDIMDGLASGVAIVATMAFFFIALPKEELYVNIASAALCGAALGFFPFNLSKPLRIFMGDGGSLFLGFVCSALAMGTSYGRQTEWGVFAPLMILCLPIFDTLFVFSMRILRGSSPFLGSKDHFALRMEILGWTRPLILIFSLGFTALLCLGAFGVTRVSTDGGLVIYGVTIVILLVFTSYLLKAKVT